MHMKTTFGISLMMIGILSFLLVISAHGVSGRIITVDKNGSGDYSRIQDAIDSAEDGDTIRVYEGTFFEMVIVHRSVSLVGNGSSETIIDGTEKDGHVIVISADFIHLSGITITNSSKGMHGVSVSANSTRIVDCAIIGNDQIGVEIRNSNDTIISTSFILSNGLYGIGGHSSNVITIYNCNISKSRGIRINDCDNLTIMNTTILESGAYGIQLFHVNPADILNTRIERSRYSGISVYYSDNVSISDCTVIEMGTDGLESIFSTCFIRNTTSWGNGRIGIRISGNNNRIINSVIGNNEQEGINLNGRNNTAVDNTLINNGIMTFEPSLIILNNTVNGKPIYYFSGITGSEIPSDAGQVILINSSDILMRRLSLSQVGTGIILYFTHNCIISDSFIDNCRNSGIYIHVGNNNLIQNCIFRNHGFYAIRVQGGQFNRISNCSINGNGFGYSGIYLAGASENLIENTIIEKWEMGLYFEASSNNTIHNCRITGSTTNGILLSQSNGNLILDTVLTGNEIGIDLRRSSLNNNVSQCDIYSNRIYGIRNRNSDLAVINSTSVFWGSSSGPYHPEKNPSGRGDAVSDGVNFDNWSTTPYNIQRPVIFAVKVDPSWVNESDTIQFSLLNWSGEGSIIRYRWRSSIDDEIYNGTDPSFSSSNLSNGTHIVFVKIMDEMGQWSDEFMTNLTVNGIPRAKIIHVSPNPSLVDGCIRFVGQGVDDGYIIRYAWRTNETDIYNGSSHEVCFTGLPNGTHAVFLRVQDNHGVWSRETMVYVVVTGRPKAYIESISPGVALHTDTISFKGHGTDDGTILTFAWRSSLDGELYNGTDSNFTRVGLSVGIHTIFLKVRDDHGFWSKEASASLIIHNKPLAFIESVIPNPAHEGERIVFTGAGTDDGTIEQYLWYSSLDGELHSGPDPFFTCSNLSNGTHIITLRVRDNHGAWSEEAAITLTVNGRPGARIIDMAPNPAAEGNPVFFSGYGSGSDGGSVVWYEWLTGGEVIHNGTDPNFTTSDLPPGDHTISFRVRDEHGVWSDEIWATLVITPRRIPTVSITFPGERDRVTGKVTIRGTASGGDGTVERVEVSIADGEWLLVTGTDAWSLEWDTRDMKNGEYTIRVRSHDGRDPSEEVTITVTVKNPKDGGGGWVIPISVLAIFMGALVAGGVLFRKRHP